MSARGNRFCLYAAGAGIVGLVLCAIGLAIDATAALRGWLAAFAFWLGLPLGALMLLLAHDLTGGRWGAAARPALEAAAATLPLIAVLFLPVLVGVGSLYAWTRPDEAAKLHNGFYLNTPFFVGRAVVYFVLWLLLAALALRRTDGASRPGAAPGLIVLAITATLAAFDWTMSVEPDWGSSIYGMLIICGHLIGALAAATLAMIITGRDGGPQVRSDLGSLLIAGILLWTYFTFMQFLIVWEENLPKEIVWYLRRATGGWGWIAVALAVCEALLPFLMLMWWPVKRSRRGLAAACCLLLGAHLLECWWLVLPGVPDRGFTWLAPAATLAFGGLWLALFAWRLERGRLLPIDAGRRDTGATAGAHHG